MGERTFGMIRAESFADFIIIHEIEKFGECQIYDY